MRLEHLRRMDLNLLLHLRALLDERGVGRAAVRAGLSQPAMSRALARLRDHLGDPLLVRTGRATTLTPRALAIARALPGLLEGLETLVGGRPSFDPAAATRTCHVGTADYGSAVLLPPLLARLAGEAPGVSVTVHPPPEDLAAALDDGRLDVAVLPRRRIGPGLVWRALFPERFVCVLRAGHPRSLTIDEFCALPHAVVTTSGRPGSAVDEALARRRRQRRVVVRVPSFLVAPLLAARSALVVTAPSRLAQELAPLGVTILPPPLDVPGFTVALGWHERFRADPAHTWFRTLVASVGHQLRAR